MRYIHAFFAYNTFLFYAIKCYRISQAYLNLACCGTVPVSNVSDGSFQAHLIMWDLYRSSNPIPLPRPKTFLTTY